MVAAQVTRYEGDGYDQLDGLEQDILDMRETVEVMWIGIGKKAVEILDKKLYRYKQDENGNYYRSAEPYLRNLDTRLRERGLPMSYTSLNRFVSDIRLYEQDLGLEDEDLLTLGKSALDEMAPTVRKKFKEEGKEAARAFVDDLLGAARANGGLPLHEVRVAVDEASGRVSKGLEIEFTPGLFGQRLKVLKLHWGTDIVDLLHAEVDADQADWVKKRMGIK